MADELKVIENSLVPVYETDKGEKVVYGSELHEVLGVNWKTFNVTTIERESYAFIRIQKWQLQCKVV